MSGLLFLSSVLLCSQTKHSQTHHAQNTYLPFQNLTILGRAQEHLSLGWGRCLSNEQHLNSLAGSQAEISNRARKGKGEVWTLFFFTIFATWRDSPGELNVQSHTPRSTPVPLSFWVQRTLCTFASSPVRSWLRLIPFLF